jgi:transcriptional regulator with XRE-family HTH domain
MSTMAQTLQSDNGATVLRLDGGKVREARLRKLLTLEELSKLASMNQSHLGELERAEGPRQVRVRTIRKLARALDVRPNDILSPRQPRQHR